MRLDDVAAFIKAALNGLVGIEIADAEAYGLATIVVGVSLLITFSLIAWNVVLWVRRRLGDDEAISDDQAAMVRLIKNDLQAMRQTIDRFGDQLGSTIGGQLDAIAETIKIPPTNDNQAEEKRGVRLFYAERVRDAVMHKFMSGWFEELQGERHQYEFNATSSSGTPFYISVATPYRRAVVADGRSDYVLEVHSDRKKLLVFEWDYERANEPKVVYLARDRKWVEDIAAWTFPPRDAAPERLQAAE